MVFSKLEAKKPVVGTPGTVVVLPFFKDLIVILGFSAIVINIIMCIIYLLVLVFKKTVVLPKWLSLVNVGFLIIEFYYFFFYK